MPGVAQTGGMIALVPSREDAAMLAVDGGDPPEELHLTLAYLGDDVTGWSPEQRDQIASDLHGLAESLSGALAGAVFARAEFNHNGDNDREPCSVYLVGDSPGLDALRSAAAQVAGNVDGVPDQRSPFVAHITAGYGIPAASLTYTGPVTFDRLRLALAGAVTDVPLGVTVPGAETKRRTSAFSLKGETVVDGIEVKNKVASKAGESRYGKPIGTELGQSRGGATADTAQADEGAKAKYAELMKLPAAARAAWIDKLSDDDLKRLSQVTYSFRSSNAEVVAARNAMATSLRKRGLDPSDYGSLAPHGAGTKKKTTAKSKTSTAKTSAGSKAKGSLGDVADRAWRARASELGGRIPASQTTEASRKKLTSAGWTTRGGSLYPPQKGMDVDGIEVKREFSKSKRDDMAKGPKAMGDGSYPIESIGDLANAIKAYGRAAADKKDAVKAHIVKNAKRLNATNMLPGDWAESTKGKGGGKPKKGVNPFAGKGKSGKALYDELSDEIEVKVMSPNPNAAKLREYWAHGEGVKKWRPGTPGDFKRLRRHLAKFVHDPRVLNGLTANIHKLATGEWPGKNAHGGKSLADLDEPEIKAAGKAVLSKDDLAAVPDEDDDDAALARHEATDVTSEDAYEQAMGDEVDWVAAGDGTIEPEDDEDDDPTMEVGIGDPDDWDGDDDSLDDGDDVGDDDEDEPDGDDTGTPPEDDEITRGIDDQLDALEALMYPDGDTSPPDPGDPTGDTGDDTGDDDIDASGPTPPRKPAAR